MCTATNLLITMFSNSNGAVLHDKLTITQIAKKFPTFADPKGFTVSLRVHINPNPQPAKSNPHPHILILYTSQYQKRNTVKWTFRVGMLSFVLCVD